MKFDSGFDLFSLPSWLYLGLTDGIGQRWPWPRVHLRPQRDVRGMVARHKQGVEGKRTINSMKYRLLWDIMEISYPGFGHFASSKLYSL